VLVHVITTKGKGYSFAESDATKYHGIGSFSLSTGNVLPPAKPLVSYSEVFGRTIVELAKKDDGIVAITAAMPTAPGLSGFCQGVPARFFDRGHRRVPCSVFCRGPLRSKGSKPVVRPVFLFFAKGLRPDHHDVALDKLHVVFCVDRAGIVGEDGPTHHGALDCSFLRRGPQRGHHGAPQRNRTPDHDARRPLFAAMGPFSYAIPVEAVPTAMYAAFAASFPFIGLKS